MVLEALLMMGALLGGWVLLQRVILPRFGVAT
jgi:hypothetical protein